MGGKRRRLRACWHRVRDVADGHDNAFDALRLFAALSVAVAHSAFYLGDSFLWYEFGDKTWFGDGVPLFFLISGFLVYQSLERCAGGRAGILGYYWRRGLRIGPALALWVVAVSLTWAISGYYAPNGSLWTIPAETSFYLVLPLVLLLPERARTAGIVTVAIAGIAAGWLADIGVLPYASLYTFVPWASIFALGMLWSIYIDRVPLRWSWAAVALAAFVVLRVYDVLDVEGRVLGSLVGLLPLSYLVMVVAHRSPAWLRGPMPFGDLSYGVYIWHMFVVHVVLHWSLGWSTYGVVAATIAMAAASWWLVERPALRLKRVVSRRSVAALA